MADSFLGEIRIFGFNYAPYDWAYCNGATMYIQQSTPLYALIGITYGGDGKTTFMLPNLTGRGITGVGSAPYELGKTLGTETVTLTESDLPGHNHSVNGEVQTNLTLMSGSPSATVLLSRCADVGGSGAKKIYSDASTPTTAMASGTIAANGSGLPHENRQPLLAMNFCISLAGTFPSFD